jgi:hypothetical protein
VLETNPAALNRLGHSPFCPRGSLKRRHLKRRPADMDREVSDAHVTGKDAEVPASLDQDCLTGFEPMLDPVDPNGSRSVDNDEQHVALLVHLVGDTLVSWPREQGGVQVGARQAPDRSWTRPCGEVERLRVDAPRPITTESPARRDCKAPGQTRGRRLVSGGG